MRLDEIINTHRQSLNDTDMVIWKYILQPLLYTAVSILFSQMFYRLLLFLGTDSLFFRLFTGACCAVFIFAVLIKSSFLTAERTRL